MQTESKIFVVCSLWRSGKNNTDMILTHVKAKKAIVLVYEDLLLKMNVIPVIHKSVPLWKLHHNLYLSNSITE